jgi:ATP-dependent protease ClpP protease subunit
MKNEQPFYKFKAEAGEEPTSAELLIYDTIGNWDEIGEVSAKAFARDLSKLPTSVKRLDIHINSPGGSVYDAQGIFSRLADHRADKIVYIDGLAASAASIVAMVGKKIFIRANANIMIHLPSAITMGTEDDHEKSIRALQSITGAMINTYQRRTGIDRRELRDMLAAETWMTAEQAVEKGFADEVRGVIKAAAIVDENRAVFNGVEFDLSRFHNVPAFTATTTREKESKKTMKPNAATAADATPPKKDDENGDGNGDETTTTTTTTTPKPPANEETKPPASEGQHPKPSTAAAETDHDKGVKVERNRVLALQKLDRPATHDIIIKAIAEGSTVVEIMADVIDAMDKANKQAARHADASVLNNIPPSDGDDDNQFGTLLKGKVQSRLKARGRRSVTHSRN